MLWKWSFLYTNFFRNCIIKIPHCDSQWVMLFYACCTPLPMMQDFHSFSNKQGIIISRWIWTCFLSKSTSYEKYSVQTNENSLPFGNGKIRKIWWKSQIQCQKRTGRTKTIDGYSHERRLVPMNCEKDISTHGWREGHY